MILFQVSDYPSARHHLLPCQQGERPAPRGPPGRVGHQQQGQEEAAEGAVHPQAVVQNTAGKKVSTIFLEIIFRLLEPLRLEHSFSLILIPAARKKKPYYNQEALQDEKEKAF